mgnify:CR=1 FL=1
MSTVLKVMEYPDRYNITTCANPPGTCFLDEPLPHMEYMVPKSRGALPEILIWIRDQEDMRILRAGPPGNRLKHLEGSEL